MKLRAITLLILLLFTVNISTPSIAATNVITDQTSKIINNLGIETAVKGKKLREYFSDNTLLLFFEGKKKEFRFEEKRYEVLEGTEVVEKGKWKVSGLLKNQIKLKVDDGSKKYYLKKINNKPVIYYYDKLPGSEGSNKIKVSIISSNKISNEDTLQSEKAYNETENLKSDKNQVQKNKKFKYEFITDKHQKKLDALEIEAKTVTRVIRKDENGIEIVLDKFASAAAEYVATKHCAQFKKFAIIFWDQIGDLSDNNIKASGDTFICSKELILKNPETGSKILYTNFDDASLYKYPDKHLYLYRYYWPPLRVSKFVKKIIKVEKKKNPNFWKEGKAKVNTVYYKDEKSIHIKGTAFQNLNKKGIAIVEAHCKKYNKNYYYFTADFNKGKNNSNLVYCSESTMSYSEASNTSIILSSNDPTLFTNEKIFTTLGLSGENVNDTQFKVYNTSNLTTFYFFESSHNFMSALELLYRAFDENTEADKLQAQIEYNRESKYSQKEKLASTKALIGGSSIKINAKLSDTSLVLSNLGRGYYEQSLPFAYSAAENAYNLFIIIKSTKENVSNSGDLLSGILENLGEVAGLASILTEIPAYTKNMVDTSKLIFSGAKSKKIKDNGNLKKALDELQL